MDKHTEICFENLLAGGSSKQTRQGKQLLLKLYSINIKQKKGRSVQ